MVYECDVQRVCEEFKSTFNALNDVQQFEGVMYSVFVKRSRARLTH